MDRAAIRAVLVRAAARPSKTWRATMQLLCCVETPSSGLWRFPVAAHYRSVQLRCTGRCLLGTTTCPVARVCGSSAARAAAAGAALALHSDKIVPGMLFCIQQRSTHCCFLLGAELPSACCHPGRASVHWELTPPVLSLQRDRRASTMPSALALPRQSRAPCPFFFRERCTVRRCPLG